MDDLHTQNPENNENDENDEDIFISNFEENAVEETTYRGNIKRKNYYEKNICRSLINLVISKIIDSEYKWKVVELCEFDMIKY